MGDAASYYTQLENKIEELREAEMQLENAISGRWNEKFLKCFTDKEYTRLHTQINEALSTLEEASHKLAAYSKNAGLETDFEHLLELRSVLLSKEYRILKLFASLKSVSDDLYGKTLGCPMASAEDEYTVLKTKLYAAAANKAAFNKIANLKKYKIKVNSNSEEQDGASMLQSFGVSNRGKAAYTASEFSVGKIITMGFYGGEPVKWMVLARKGDLRTLAAMNGQDVVCFNQDKWKGNVWENSDICQFLNETYYNAAFCEEERAAIVTGPTGDNVWLLSTDEAKKYFNSNEARKCLASPFAKMNGAYTDREGKGWWWLRTPGHEAKHAVRIYSDGSFDDFGCNVDYGDGLVRPAIVVSVRLLTK